MFFTLVSIEISSFGICKDKFLELVSISKPSWKLRGEFHLGGVLFSQRKKHLKQGEKFQILKMLLAILLIYLWLFAKGLWKDFPKEFAKTKQVVQMWSKMLIYQIKLIYLEMPSSQNNLCTSVKMQTSYISILCICFGLCWHQSPKRGRLKGK
jgi:hypothetical protein